MTDRLRLPTDPHLPRPGALASRCLKRLNDAALFLLVAGWVILAALVVTSVATLVDEVSVRVTRVFDGLGVGSRPFGLWSFDFLGSILARVADACGGAFWTTLASWPCFTAAAMAATGWLFARTRRWAGGTPETRRAGA